MEYKKYKENNINIYNVQTNKFKNAYIEVRFRDDVKNVDSPIRSFLLQLIGTTNSKYKTNRELNIALEEIYDADIYTSTVRTGYIYTSCIGIDFLNPKYIKEKDYLKNVFNMLVDCIVYPHVKDGKWDEVVFQNNIDNFSVYIDRYKENPIDYTILESKKRLFNNSVVGTRVVGTKNDIKRITPQSLYQEWQKMLENSCLDIIIVGDLPIEDIIEYIKNSPLKNNSPKDLNRFIINEEIKPYKTHTEGSDFNQTSMIMYYQNKSLTNRERYYTGPLFRNILGSGGLSDKLGNYLRMKNSLCYAYSCQMVIPDSYMFIGTSLSKENVNKAKECIIKAMNDMKHGYITKTELMMHKSKFLNDIKLRQDDIYAIGNNYYNHELHEAPLYEEYEKEIDSITIDEIKAYAKKWTLTYLFILKERG